MKKKFFLLKLIKVLTLSPILVVVACRMPSHKIEVVIKHANEEKTIFDNIFRLSAFDDLFNHLAYDEQRNNVESYLTNHYKNLTFKKWGEAAKEFYESFYTRSKDTFFTGIEILNDFSSKKNFYGNTFKTFSNIVDAVEIDKDGKETVLERQIKDFIKFNISFKGFNKEFLLSGSVKLNFKVEKVVEKKFYSFAWIYKKDTSELNITNISEKKS